LTQGIRNKPIQGIWVQRQALVSIGSKKSSFIKKENGFKAREIKTGIELNDFRSSKVGVKEAMTMHNI
jgi:Cu(I)/Ag(I) efflux system membrane fusion protein